MAASTSVDVASKSTGSLRDLVDATPASAIPGSVRRAHPRVLPLLDGLPKALGGVTKPSRDRGRFVRIELLGRRRTLTPPKSRSIATDGTSPCAAGLRRKTPLTAGSPGRRAIDGNKNGDYGDGGQDSHAGRIPRIPGGRSTGALSAIDSVAVWNRTEGDYFTRLNRYTVKVLGER